MTAPLFDVKARRNRLGIRHLLAPGAGAGSVEEVGRALVALHSTDPVTVFLAVAGRLPDVTVDDVEQALYETRSVFRHHAMRRTLWVMPPDVVVDAHAACTREIAARETARFESWVDGTEGIADGRAWHADARTQILAYVAANGPTTTREIGAALPHLTVPIVVGRGRQTATIPGHSRTLLLLGFEGLTTRAQPLGSWVGSQYHWVDAGVWGLPDLSSREPPDGAAGLLQRYLERFGPATLTDIRWWAGWTAMTARRALKAIDATTVTLESGEEAYVAAADVGDDDIGEPWVALLPGLDPTVMGWKERSWFLGEGAAARVFDRNGNAGPTVWADGEVVGGWAQRPDGEIAVELFTSLGRAHEHQLAESVQRLRTFMGESRFRPRFPPPNQADLLR